MPVLLCTTMGLEKAVFFFFLRNFVYSLFQKSRPLVFWVQKKSTPSIFVIHTFLKRLEQCNFFDVWIKKIAWKMKLSTFCKMLVLCLPLRNRPHLPSIRAPVKAVFLASHFTFALKSLKPRQLVQLHLWLESPSLYHSSSETEAMLSFLRTVNLPAISSSRTSFEAKTRERSKY